MYNKIFFFFLGLCHQHPSSLKNSKQILNHTLRLQLNQALDDEQLQFIKCFQETGGPAGVAKWKKIHVKAKM